MSPRIFVILFFILPVFEGKGGFGGRGGFGRGHSSGHGVGHSGGYGGGSHGYPSSGTGLSGTGSGGYRGTQNRVNTNTQHATYPQSTGYSGNNNPVRNTHVQKTEIHHHYHYSPPQQISYGGGHHPVYYGTPPVYVYQYRDSGSRFDNLLTGLALYNLGRMSAHHDSYGSRREYSGHSGEVCKLGIKKNNGDYEETRVECRLMSSFIWDAEKEPNRVVSTHTVTNTVTSTNSVNNNTVTTVNTTVVDAMQVKGQSLQVTPGMTCYMIRISRDSSSMKKHVDCGLLQAYAQTSFRNRSTRHLPVFSLVLSLIVYWIC